MSVTSASIELRCPVGPKALLGKVRSAGESVSYTDDNLIELACRDCARTMRKREPDVVRVLHHFNILGELVNSEIVRR